VGRFVSISPFSLVVVKTLCPLWRMTELDSGTIIPSHPNNVSCLSACTLLLIPEL
jgi:hypothetical protein